MRHSDYTLSAAILLVLFIGATSLMPSDVYSSAWWLIFWSAILAVIIFIIVTRRLWRKKGVLLFHISLVCMIVGGILTSVTSMRGTIHLRPGKPESHFMGNDSNLHPLPSEITLLSFEKIYYPAMTIPRDFKSTVMTATGDTMDISMNRIGMKSAYRFYQTSYDNDGGSVLTVSYDPYGITVTYIGFALFFLAGIWMLLYHDIRSLKCMRKKNPE